MARNTTYEKFLLYTVGMIQNTVVTYMMPEIENS